MTKKVGTIDSFPHTLSYYMSKTYWWFQKSCKHMVFLHTCVPYNAVNHGINCKPPLVSRIPEASESIFQIFSSIKGNTSWLKWNGQNIKHLILIGDLSFPMIRVISMRFSFFESLIDAWRFEVFSQVNIFNKKTDWWVCNQLVLIPGSRRFRSSRNERLRLQAMHLQQRSKVGVSQYGGDS